MKYIVTNEYGVQIDFYTAVELMDDEVRESVHAQLSPCTEQEFFNAYSEMHEKKFGEVWEPAKENPVM